MTTPARDPGGQPERTLLAWRRTALAIVIGSIAATRLLPLFWADTGLLLAGAGILLGIAIMGLAQRRYLRQRRAFDVHVDDTPVLDGPEYAPMPGGAVQAVLAGVTLAIGLTAAVLVLTR